MAATTLTSPPAGRRQEIAVYVGLALLGLAALASATAGVAPLPVLGAITVALGFTAAHRWLLAWRTLLGTIVVVVLFIPIKRYDLPVHLPLQIEPYRLLVGAVGAALLGTLLIDPTVRVRRTGLDGPIIMLAAALALSVLSRGSHILGAGLSTDVARTVMFFASYLVVFYLTSIALTRRSEVETILRLLVGGAAVVALTAVVESQTHYNLFDHLSQVVPVLHFNGVPYAPDRGGARAYASAQHPIAMGAALMMLVPLGLYLARSTGQNRWWLATALLFMGALATKSRTAVIMMVVILVVMLILQPGPTRRVLPKLLPLLIVVHLAMPGTIGTFKDAFLPKSGIVNSETNAQAEWHSNYGVGRIGEWKPALREFRETPLFGQGMGARITDLADPHFNAPILDDQWLGSLLELGVVGVVALTWFFTTAIRRLGRLARYDDSHDGWLLTGLAASLAAYAFGMFTFDAFAFVQVTMIMFLIAALSVVVLRPQRLEPAR